MIKLQVYIMLCRILPGNESAYWTQEFCPQDSSKKVSKKLVCFLLSAWNILKNEKCVTKTKKDRIILSCFSLQKLTNKTINIF